MRKSLRVPGVVVGVALAVTGVWLGVTVAGYGRPVQIAIATTTDPVTKPTKTPSSTNTAQPGPLLPAPSPKTETQPSASTTPANDTPKKPTAPPVQTLLPPAAAGTLEEGVQQAFTDFPGTWAVAVMDLQTGQRWIMNGNERFLTASTVKIPVALYAMVQEKAGRLHWDDQIQYQEEDFESPGGDLEDAPYGTWFTVGDLVNQAIEYSNNIAVNMLGRHLGWQNIRDWTKSIGGELYREEDASPSATVANEIVWWQFLYQYSQKDPQTAALVMDPLHLVEYQGRIAQGLPKGVEFVHKYGSWDPYFHDSGIVWAKHPYALVIMTNGATEEEADVTIAQATAATYAYMNSH